MKFYLAIFLAILCSSTLAINGKCRALALAGGGDKGSYEASVFIEFTNLLPKEDVSYDVITGASAGSLNGAGLSLFAPGDEDEAAEFIFGLWNSIQTSDILRQWDEGILAGIFTKPGLFSNQPLIDFLYEQIGPRTINKKFTAVITNADSGHSEAVDFNKTDFIPDDAIPTIVASSAIPFAFPSMHKNGATYVDGGCIWNLDVAGAIRRCKEVVEKDEDIIVDIMLCSYHNITKPGDLKKMTALEHFYRGQQIQEWEALMADLERAKFLFPNINFRYVVGPSEELSSGFIPLDFSKDHLDVCFDVGKRDARNAIALGEGGYMDAMVEHYRRVKAGENVTLKEILTPKLDALDQVKEFISE